MKDAAPFIAAFDRTTSLKKFNPLPKRKGRSTKEVGGVVVELVIALWFLFFFFVIYIQTVGTFIAHERISYSAYAGARVNVVGGNVGKAVSLTKGKAFSVMGETVLVNELLKLPIDLWDINKKGRGFFKIEARCTLPVEEGGQGDN
jgi:preprotein translocase subunit YajC